MEHIRPLSDSASPPREGDVWRDGVWTRRVGEYDVVVVPDSSDASEVKQAIFAVSHSLTGIHSSPKTTVETVRRSFVWTNLVKDVESMALACMVCKLAKNPGRRSVPVGMNRPALAPFSVLGMDFAEFEIPSSAGHRYFLVTFDVFSHHVLVYPTKGKSAEDTAFALLDFSKYYMDPLCIWSDQGTHFTAEVIRHLATLKHQSQIFTLPHMESSRGLLERMVGCVKDRARAFMLEIKAPPEDWHLYLPVVASIYNNLPSQSLCGHAPNTILFGFARLPTQVVWDSSLRTVKDVPLSVAAKSHVEELVQDLTLIHHELELRRFSPRHHVARDSDAFQPEFSVDDYVLIAYPDSQDKKNSLAARWSSVGRVSEVCSAWSYKVHDLLRRTTDEFHVSRLRPANNLCYSMSLSDWESVFYSALLSHNISHISDFSVQRNHLMCFVHYFKPSTRTRSGQLPAGWENVSKWYPKLPRYFDAMITLGLIKDEQCLRMLEAIRDKFLKKVELFNNGNKVGSPLWEGGMMK